MSLELTEYYDEFIRYFHLAHEQQKKCNVSEEEPYGMIPHMESDMGDDLNRTARGDRISITTTFHYVKCKPARPLFTCYLTN